MDNKKEGGLSSESLEFFEIVIGLALILGSPFFPGPVITDFLIGAVGGGAIIDSTQNGRHLSSLINRLRNPRE